MTSLGLVQMTRKRVGAGPARGLLAAVRVLQRPRRHHHLRPRGRRPGRAPRARARRGQRRQWQRCQDRPGHPGRDRRAPPPRRRPDGRFVGHRRASAGRAGRERVRGLRARGCRPGTQRARRARTLRQRPPSSPQASRFRGRHGRGQRSRGRSGPVRGRPRPIPVLPCACLRQPPPHPRSPRTGRPTSKLGSRPGREAQRSVP